MSDERYNGWRNYETWAVALWIDNEEGSQGYWKVVVDKVRATHERGLDEDAGEKPDVDDMATEIADRLKDEMEDAANEVIPHGTLWTDLIGASLSMVDWREIAKNWLEE